MASVERLVARLTGNREKILRYVWIPQLSVGLFLLGLAYFQLVPIKISAQFFSLLLQLHAKVNCCTVKIRIHYPSPGNIAARGTCCLLRALSQQNLWNKEQQKQDFAHDFLLRGTF
jgi:hypothetical protein